MHLKLSGDDRRRGIFYTWLPVLRGINPLKNPHCQSLSPLPAKRVILPPFAGPPPSLDLQSLPVSSVASFVSFSVATLRSCDPLRSATSKDGFPFLVPSYLGQQTSPSRKLLPSVHSVRGRGRPYASRPGPELSIAAGLLGTGHAGRQRPLCPYNPQLTMLVIGPEESTDPSSSTERTVYLRFFPGVLHAWALAHLGLTRAAAKALVQCSVLKFTVAQHCRLVQPAPLQPEGPSNWEHPLLEPPRSTIPASCFRVSG